MKNIVNPMEEKKPVALLDVDHTLLFTHNQLDALNTHLLTALKNKGIMDVYLFTDMVFKDRNILDRSKLLESLQQKGFSVHGVLTPNDLTWPEIFVDETIDLATICYQEGYNQNSSLEDFEKMIKNRLPHLEKVVSEYKYDNKYLGKAFEEAKKSWEENNKELANPIKNRSSFAKMFADHLSVKYGYSHCKALLFDLFLRRRPSWVGRIIVADDNQDLIESIRNFKPVEPLNYPPVATIWVKNNETLPKDYEEQMEKNPLFFVHTKIDQHISKLQSGRNPFMRSAQPKIDALKALKNYLSTSTLTSIDDAMKKWRSENEHVLKAHRNRFFSKDRPSIRTATETFWDELCQEVNNRVNNDPCEKLKKTEFGLSQQSSIVFIENELSPNLDKTYVEATSSFDFKAIDSRIIHLGSWKESYPGSTEVYTFKADTEELRKKIIEHPVVTSVEGIMTEYGKQINQKLSELLPPPECMYGTRA